MAQTNNEGETFGEWLLAQKDREGDDPSIQWTPLLSP